MQAGNIAENGIPLGRPPTPEGYPVGHSRHSNPLYAQPRPPNQEVKTYPSWHPMHNPDSLSRSSGQRNDAYKSFNIKPSDFPATGQQNDGKLVKKSDFHGTAEMKSDGVQRTIHAGRQIMGSPEITRGSRDGSRRENRFHNDFLHSSGVPVNSVFLVEGAWLIVIIL